MVYGIVKLINFAHGDVFMVGAFTSFYAVSQFNLHQWPQMLFPGLPRRAFRSSSGPSSVILLSMVVCTLLAVTIERVAYKPLRDAPRIAALITAIGVSFFLEFFGALQFVSPPVHPLQEPLRHDGLVHPGRDPSDCLGAEQPGQHDQLFQHIPDHPGGLRRRADLPPVPRPPDEDRRGDAGSLVRQTNRPARWGSTWTA